MEERENKRPAGSRPSGSRPSGKRPTRERPNGSRPSGKRPSGSRPSNYSKAKKRRPQSKRRRKVYLYGADNAYDHIIASDSSRCVCFGRDTVLPKNRQI